MEKFAAFVARFVTARAAVAAFAVSVLFSARRFGVVIPEGTEDAVSKVIDSAAVAAAALFGFSAFHKTEP